MISELSGGGRVPMTGETPECPVGGHCWEEETRQRQGSIEVKNKTFPVASALSNRNAHRLGHPSNVHRL